MWQSFSLNLNSVDVRKFRNTTKVEVYSTFWNDVDGLHGSSFPSPNFSDKSLGEPSGPIRQFFKLNLHFNLTFWNC